jgi:hypothetical protein
VKLPLAGTQKKLVLAVGAPAEGRRAVEWARLRGPSWRLSYQAKEQPQQLAAHMWAVSEGREGKAAAAAAWVGLGVGSRGTELWTPGR